MDTKKYVVLLRGINVGGHHKVPMKDLKNELEGMGFENIVTLLNSGNIILEAKKFTSEKLEAGLTQSLGNIFGFSIPVIAREANDMAEISNLNPFRDVAVTKDTRLYVSFLKKETNVELTFPWKTGDGSYQILNIYKKIIFSVLDLSITKTTKGMDTLEQMFGKDITTRNWNTVKKIVDKLNSVCP